jgi:hypothetical protein
MAGVIPSGNHLADDSDRERDRVDICPACKRTGYEVVYVCAEEDNDECTECMNILQGVNTHEVCPSRNKIKRCPKCGHEETL